MKALNSLPIAILPLGRTNELASALCGNEDEVRSMAEATMAVIDGSLRQIDVIKIEPIEVSQAKIRPLIEFDTMVVECIQIVGSLLIGY